MLSLVKRTNAKLENYRKLYPKLKIIIFSVSLSPTKEISRYLQWRSDSFLTLRESEKEIIRELDYIFLKPYEEYEFRKKNIIKIEQLPENEPHLTYRELEIVRCVVDCNTIKEMADEFMLSERTVQNYISNIYGKFGIRNIVGVLKLAVSKGIISVDELKA